MSVIKGIAGRVRGIWEAAYAENLEEQQLHITSQGDEVCALAVPLYADIVRHGDSWAIVSAAFTGLTAVPTTAGVLSLWNGEQQNNNGKSLIIHSVSVWRPIIDVTNIEHFAVWCQLVRAPVTALADSASILPVSLSGRNTGPSATYDGRARKAASSTTISGRWDQCGALNPGGVANAIAGTGWLQVECDLFGRYIVPPGAMFAIHVSELTATASAFQACIKWHEMRLPVV